MTTTVAGKPAPELVARIERGEPVGAQELFDHIARHLLAQDRRSTTSADDPGTCAYRGLHGRTCAVGCVIPDELYREEMDFPVLKTPTDVAGLIAHDLLPESLLPHRSLLRDLQSTHDHCGDLGRRALASALREDAETHGLSDAVLREARA